MAIPPPIKTEFSFLDETDKRISVTDTDFDSSIPVRIDFGMELNETGVSLTRAEAQSLIVCLQKYLEATE